VVLAPLAIVWGCPLSVSEYEAAGKLVEVPELTCPGCEAALRPWSWYERRIREGGEKRPIWVRRGRCPPCAVTHALLPDFVHERRLDAVEVIGRALEMGAQGVGAWRSSEQLELPFSTVRDWRSRCRRRAPELLAKLARVGLSVGAQIGELPVRALVAMVAVLKAVWARCRERQPALARLWRFWNVVCGGRALARNTSPV
jgi:hypothetical protein